MRASEHDHPDIAAARAVGSDGPDPTHLVFLDESGVATNLLRRYGCRWESSTFIAALRVTGLTAPGVLDGPMDGASFLAYVAVAASRKPESTTLIVAPVESMAR